MSIAAKIRRTPLRASAGAYILNAGLTKFHADEDTSKSLHELASGAFPPLDRLDHKTFVKVLSVAEISLGAAVLLPIVPTAVAGLGLTAFASSVLTMWWRTPGMHEGIRPTQDGTVIAKDVWMLGAGTALVLDALTEPAHDKTVAVSATAHEKVRARRRSARRARMRLAKTAADSAHTIADRAHDAAERITNL